MKLSTKKLLKKRIWIKILAQCRACIYKILEKEETDIIIIALTTVCV